jgi:hypothetical protein
LSRAEIHLFDPAGDTAATFESARIPFDPILQIESLDLLRGALIVIGEGLNLGHYPGLTESLIDAMDRNNNVILLAPSGGSLAFKLTDQKRLVLEDATVVAGLDRRFDVESWAGESPIRVRWEISQSKNELSFKESNSPAAWPWIEFHKRISANAGVLKIAPESTFTLCGLGITSRWNDGPVAKHLLLEMIRQNTNLTLATRTQERTGASNDQ